MTPARVTAEFSSWVGVPWVHQGRTRHGVDCAGLMVVVLSDLGLLPRGFRDISDYGREAGPRLAQVVRQWCAPTEVAVEGVIVLIRWPGSHDPGHVAYCAGRNLVHAYSRMVGRTRAGPTSQTGRVVEHRYGEPWLRQTVGLYLIPGVEYP